MRRLSLRDWEIDLITEPNPPVELAGSLSELARTAGMSVWDYDEESGVVWLPLKKLEALNVSPVATCVHEMLHCVMGKIDEELSDNEYLINLFTPLVYESYLFDKKKK